MHGPNKRTYKRYTKEGTLTYSTSDTEKEREEGRGRKSYTIMPSFSDPRPQR